MSSGPVCPWCEEWSDPRRTDCLQDKERRTWHLKCMREAASYIAHDYRQSSPMFMDGPGVHAILCVESDMLTIPEAAEELGVAIPYLKRLCNDGTLPYNDDHPTRYVRHADVKALQERLAAERARWKPAELPVEAHDG